MLPFLMFCDLLHGLPEMFKILHQWFFLGSIFAAGGDSRSSVERYDPREGFWTEIPSMRHKRGGVAAVALKSEIYSIGNNLHFMRVN